MLLHLNLLLEFYLLSGKLYRLDRTLGEAVAQGLDRERADDRRAQLYPFPFSQMLVGEHGRLMRFLLWLMVWLTVLVLPVVLLLMGQVRFLPYHDAWTTMWLRFMVAVDLLLILIFWHAIRHPAARLLNYLAAGSGTKPRCCRSASSHWRSRSWSSRSRATMMPATLAIRCRLCSPAKAGLSARAKWSFLI